MRLQSFLNTNLFTGEGIGISDCNTTAATCMLMTSRVLSNLLIAVMKSLFGKIEVELEQDQRIPTSLAKSLADQLGM